MAADPVRRRRPLARATCARSPTRTPGWCRSPRATATASAWAGSPRRAAWLGVDTLAVGTYDELARGRAPRFDGDAAGAHPVAAVRARRAACDAARVVHTVGRLEDLARPAGRASPSAARRARAAHLDAAPRLHRPRACARPARCSREHPAARLEGVALHLPLATGSHLAEVEPADDRRRRRRARRHRAPVWV